MHTQSSQCLIQSFEVSLIEAWHIEEECDRFTLVIVNTSQRGIATQRIFINLHMISK